MNSSESGQPGLKSTGATASIPAPPAKPSVDTSPILLSVFWAAKDNRAIEGQVAGLRATGPADRLKPGEMVQFQLFHEPAPPPAKDAAPAGGAAPAAPPAPRFIGNFIGSVAPGLASYDWTVKLAKPGEPPATGSLLFHAVARGQKLTSAKLLLGSIAPPKVTDLKLVGRGGSSRPYSTGAEKISEADAFCFAPGSETPKISYKVADPGKQLRSATLMLVRAKDAKTLWTRPMKPDELTHGDHAIEWDGSVKEPPCAFFPDGYPTVEHSPYELKIAATSATGKADPAWTFFRVKLGDLKIEKGKPEQAALERNRKLLGALSFTEVPASGEIEAPLSSDCYKLSLDEMYDQTGTTQYASMWGDGPTIPIVARLTVKTSDGRSVDAPAALGAVKVLWDWSCVPAQPAGLGPDASIFVDLASGYQKDATSPRGTNCHVARGGKRGEGASPVFPARPGLAACDAPPDGVFPWKIDAAKRKGAALSTAWAKGKYAGQAGIDFSPSRMAGDAYALRACAVAEGTDLAAIDVDGEIAPPVSRSTGAFRIWRELHLERLWLKNESIPAIDLAAVRQAYECGFVRIKIAADAKQVVPAASFQAQLKLAISREPWYIQAALDPAADQRGSTSGLVFLPWDKYKAAVKSKLDCSIAKRDAWLAANRAGNALDYAVRCREWAVDILTKMSSALIDPQPGINVVQFGTTVTNLEPDAGKATGGYLEGQAVDALGASRSRTILLIFNTVFDVLVHELGHQLFLPHAPGAPGEAKDVHDVSSHACTMGYALQRPRFCGFCYLRLRGWNKAALSNSGPANA